MQVNPIHIYQSQTNPVLSGFVSKSPVQFSLTWTISKQYLVLPNQFEAVPGYFDLTTKKKKKNLIVQFCLFIKLKNFSRKREGKKYDFTFSGALLRVLYNTNTPTYDPLIPGNLYSKMNFIVSYILQRLFVEMVQMARRPFSSVQVEIEPKNTQEDVATISVSDTLSRRKKVRNFCVPSIEISSDVGGGDSSFVCRGG